MCLLPLRSQGWCARRPTWTTCSPPPARTPVSSCAPSTTRTARRARSRTTRRSVAAAAARSRVGADDQPQPRPDARAGSPRSAAACFLARARVRGHISCAGRRGPGVFVNPRHVLRDVGTRCAVLTSVVYHELLGPGTVRTDVCSPCALDAARAPPTTVQRKGKRARMAECSVSSTPPPPRAVCAPSESLWYVGYKPQGVCWSHILSSVRTHPNQFLGGKERVEKVPNSVWSSHPRHLRDRVSMHDGVARPWNFKVPTARLATPRPPPPPRIAARHDC